MSEIGWPFGMNRRMNLCWFSLCPVHMKQTGGRSTHPWLLSACRPAHWTPCRYPMVMVWNSDGICSPARSTSDSIACADRLGRFTINFRMTSNRVCLSARVRELHIMLIFWHRWRCRFSQWPNVSRASTALGRSVMDGPSCRLCARDFRCFDFRIAVRLLSQIHIFCAHDLAVQSIVQSMIWHMEWVSLERDRTFIFSCHRWPHPATSRWITLSVCLPNLTNSSIERHFGRRPQCLQWFIYSFLCIMKVDHTRHNSYRHLTGVLFFCRFICCTVPVDFVIDGLLTPGFKQSAIWRLGGVSSLSLQYCDLCPIHLWSGVFLW